MEDSTVVSLMLTVLIIAMISGAVIVVGLSPSDDRPDYSACIKSHTESHVVVNAGTPMGGIPIGNNLEIQNESVCDQTKTYHCVRWERRKNWMGKSYNACVAYE